MTDIKKTFEALNAYFVDDFSSKVNTEWLNRKIYDQFDIVYRSNKGRKQSILRELAAEKRRNMKALIWKAFLEVANEALEYEIETENRATSDQLKKWLAKNNLDYSVFDQAKKDIEKLLDAERAEQRRSA